MPLRPYRSPSLPYNGVTTVWASRYAVTTQESRARPPSSPTIVGNAVDTIVESSAASSMPSTRPLKTTRTCRCESRAGAAGEAAIAVTMGPLREFNSHLCESRAVGEPGERSNIARTLPGIYLGCVLMSSARMEGVTCVEIERSGSNGLATDCPAVEEPLEIRLQWGDADEPRLTTVAVTMRTPGCDAELAAAVQY